MASPETKNEVIQGAFSQLRISGITVIPGPKQQALALRRLELTMAELIDPNIWNLSIPYNFEQEPDFGSPHNLPKGLIDAVEVYLAVRMLADFGKVANPALAMRVKGAIGALFKYSSKASTPRVNYPNRMPMGKRINSVYPNNNFFPDFETTPIESSTIVMYNGDRRDFLESFLTDFNETEVIDSFTIEADDELTINSSSNSDYAVTFDITATGSSDGSTSVPKLKIVATTDESNIFTRIIYFKLLVSEI